MPDESCRSCGGELEDNLKCKECKKVTRYECRSCNKKTPIQYHVLCNIGKEDPIAESIKNNFQVVAQVPMILGLKRKYA